MHPERISNIKPLINKYKWKRINYPSKTDDWKTFEKNNSIIALNILYIKEKKVCPSYISKLNYEKQIILLMIPSEEKERWHFFAAKRLSALLRGITAKHDNVYYLNCLHSFRTESKLRFHEKVCKKNEFCGFVIPSERDNILELNQYMMSDKMPYIVYIDIESLIKK